MEHDTEEWLKIIFKMCMAKFLFQQQYLPSHLLFLSVTFSHVSLNGIISFSRQVLWLTDSQQNLREVTAESRSEKAVYFPVILLRPLLCVKSFTSKKCDCPETVVLYKQAF